MHHKVSVQRETGRNRMRPPLRSLALAALLVTVAVSTVAPGAIAVRRRQAPLVDHLRPRERCKVVIQG